MRHGTGSERQQAGAYSDDCDDSMYGHERVPSSVAGVSRRSAGSRSLPHSHPKALPSGPHAESDPSSTVFSPHSSHTRTTCPEVPYTSNPLLRLVGHGRPCGPRREPHAEPLRATALSSTTPSVRVGRYFQQDQAASTCTSSRTPHGAEARVHLNLDLRLLWAPMDKRCLLLGGNYARLDSRLKLGKLP